LGNIYTDEVLFRTQVAPLRRAGAISECECQKLAAAVREVLCAAIAGRGTSISDFVDLEGEPGGYQFALQVYGRTGEPCVGCGTPIERTVVAGRGTWHCPICQR
jgi:formamidopyrimidine-DNA glycosylase